MVARNREQLIHIAARLFLSKGFKYTSITDVVERSGISRSNLYFHFKSKEELLFEVVSFWANRYEAALEVSLGQADLPARERIEAFIRLLLSELEGREGKGYCPFIAMYQQSPTEAIDVCQRIEAFFNRFQQMIATLLNQGIENGEFRATINANESAFLFVSALEGSLVLAETLHNIQIVRTTSEQFFTLLEHQ